MSAGVELVVGPAEGVAPGRVEVPIGEEVAAFSSGDVDLVPDGHAAASAGLLVGALARRPVRVRGRVDRRFARGMRLLDRTVSRWWGVHIDHRTLEVGRHPSPPPPGGRGSLLCFTGGVDSFHALRHHASEVDALLFVHGFDIDVDDTIRAAAAEAMVRDVARARGLEAVVVRTDLRRTRPYLSTDWGQTHGGALAAVAHLLSGSFDRLVIASSYAWQADRPWGSHWRTDRRWRSGRLRIDHVDHRHTRAEKVARIVDDPLVRRHLLVCWQRRGEPGNCLECPKCVMTAAMVDHFADLGDFPTLLPRGDLEGRLAALPPDPLYAPSLEVIARGTSELAAVARTRLAEGPPAPAPTPWPRRLADHLGLP